MTAVQVFKQANITSRYYTNLSMPGPGDDGWLKNYTKIAAKDALLKIAEQLDSFHTVKEFEDFSITWVDTDKTGIYEGDVVVSIYSQEELDDYNDDELDLNNTKNMLDVKCNCWNDNEMHDVVRKMLEVAYSNLRGNDIKYLTSKRSFKM